MLFRVDYESCLFTYTQVCYGVICPPGQYHPDKDVLNAAQSGAMMPNLVKHELNYLLEQLNKVQVFVVMYSFVKWLYFYT